MSADGGTLVSVEALVRWDRPAHGFCLPIDFVPHAEASDLIVRLDCWVLDAALEQLAEWHRDGFTPGSVSVNISGRHLQSGQLGANVAAALSRHGADPAALTLELTETVLLADMERAAAELEHLRARTIRVAIDDFGTGYTSLSHLHHLTVDSIKIDRSFVSQLPRGRDSSLVRMVTDLGHHFGVSIVGEGVETHAQLEALREIGCDAVQGYLLARAMPVPELRAWHAAWLDGLSQARR
jgi:EAL domain-containing protein (putative c-di-GMP-specific phosphodiesterase class I)